MRLFEFVPIYDQVIDDDSLIERVFGPEFCVVDESNHLLTTAHNQNLLLRARALLVQGDAADGEDVEEELTTLRAMAEIVTQEDYDLAVRREILDSDTDNAFDYSLRAGSLI